MNQLDFISVIVSVNDINKPYYDLIKRNNIVACDIETSGLNWRDKKIATAQFFTPNNNNDIIIVKINNNKPKSICSIIENPNITKIFHHAMFDLRFMSFHWKITPQNIMCTKISAKLLDLNKQDKNHLVDLLEKHLRIQINKDQTKSNWFSEDLTQEQKYYAANDVLYLIPLLTTLKEKLMEKNLWNLTLACFNHISTRVQLEVKGYKDVYVY